MSKEKEKEEEIVFGVHNERFNMDYYEDGSIKIYDHKNLKEITTFDIETVAIFMAVLDRDGEMTRLLNYDKRRIEKLGMNLNKSLY